MATVPFAHATACRVPTYSAKLSANAFASVFDSGKPPQLREASTRASACSSGSPYSGQAGQARKDGVTDEIAADLLARGERIIEDPALLRWFYEGGEPPG